MTSIPAENLEERIERIRKRTEEIEKKHRAAEEDRLMALMDNAMVKTKPPKDEDWPKAHKYDKLDFTYDIKQDKLEENIEQKQLLKPKRDYKKFADGEGPPPDPIYNFLADAERDGIVLQQKEQQQQHQQHKINDKKDLKQNQLNNSGNNGRNIDNNSKNKDQFNKRGSVNGGQQNNNSFRNRGGGHNNNGNNVKSQQNNRYQKQSSQSDNQKQNLQPEQWRSEKIDDNNKINRQKLNNGSSSNNCEKWRRGDWDTNNDMKTDKNDLHNNKSPKHNTNNANKNYYQHHHSNQQQQSQQNYHQQNISNIIYTPVENIIEKRGNIMVSVSPGEVKSVKLTSAQVIGSGRVGPRQLTKPQFHIQTMEKEEQNINVPSSPRPQINTGNQQKINKLNNINNQHNNIHNNYQQFATKNSVPPTHRQQQTTPNQPQLNLNTNNGITLAPKSPIKDKKNSKSSKYIPPQQQQKPILPNLITIVGGAGGNTGDNVLTSPTITTPILVNNMVNSLLNATANTVGGGNTATNSDTVISKLDITVPEIDVKVLAVAKELSNKPEFAKKSVQDRLLRIRQMSQPDVVSSPPLSSGDGDSVPNNNNIVDQIININNIDNLNATLLIKDANKDEQNDCIKNIETIVACN